MTLISDFLKFVRKLQQIIIFLQWMIIFQERIMDREKKIPLSITSDVCQ